MNDPTPSQTVGPFFHDALTPDDTLTTDSDEVGEPVVLEGRVLDADGEPVADAMVESWRADPDRSDHDGRGEGWARARTDRNGTYRLRTRRPRRLPHPSGAEQAPHLVLLVFARGLLDHLLTRAYLVDEERAPDDPVLASVPESRRATLLAVRTGEVDGTPSYRFDVRLQGDAETVFFAV